MKLFKAAGYECIRHKREASDVAIAYMTRADFSLILELVEPINRIRPPKD